MQDPSPEFTQNHRIREMAVYKIGGKNFTTRQLAHLSGAPDGTKFAFGKTHGGVIITGDHPQFFQAGKQMERLLINDSNRGLVLINAQFHMKPEYHGGVGFQMLNSQINACRELEVTTIACIAGRWAKDEQGKRTPLDGYIVWPKLGFDGPLPATSVETLGPNFSHCRTVQQLIQADEGLAQWVLHGDGCRLTFDVDPNSVHSQTFVAYGKRKGFFP